MAKELSPFPKHQFFDENGDPLVGGKVYTYLAGTTTPTTTWTDSTGGAANTNPIVLDARGECDIWLTPGTEYKFVLTDSVDVEIYTVDTIATSYIFDSDNTWTGTNVFSGDVTFSSGVSGDTIFNDNVTITGDLTVSGSLDVVGTVTFGSIAPDDVTTSLITIGSAGTIQDSSGTLVTTAVTHHQVKTNNGTHTWDFEQDGQLLLPAVAPTDDNHAVSKSYVDAAVSGGISTSMVAIGKVESNALTDGSGIASVTHPGTGHYVVTLTTAVASVAKMIVQTTHMTVHDRNYTAIPVISSTTVIDVYTGGGNSYAAIDEDFMICVWELP